VAQGLGQLAQRHVGPLGDQPAESDQVVVVELPRVRPLGRERPQRPGRPRRWMSRRTHAALQWNSSATSIDEPCSSYDAATAIRNSIG